MKVIGQIKEASNDVSRYSNDKSCKMKLIDLVEKHLFYFRTFIQQKFILINKLVDPRFDFSIDSLSQLPIFQIKCSSQ